MKTRRVLVTPEILLTEFLPTMTRAERVEILQAIIGCKGSMMSMAMFEEEDDKGYLSWGFDSMAGISTGEFNVLQAVYASKAKRYASREAWRHALGFNKHACHSKATGHVVPFHAQAHA